MSVQHVLLLAGIVLSVLPAPSAAAAAKSEPGGGARRVASRAWAFSRLNSKRSRDDQLRWITEEPEASRRLHLIAQMDHVRARRERLGFEQHGVVLMTMSTGPQFIRGRIVTRRTLYLPPRGEWRMHVLQTRGDDYGDSPQNYSLDDWRLIESVSVEQVFPELLHAETLTAAIRDVENNPRYLNNRGLVRSGR